MPEHARTPLMYAPRLAASTLLPLALLLGSVPARAQLIEGIESWADATIGLSTTRWTGPRVPTPVPEPRPQASVRLDARALPLSVHASERVSPARLHAALRAAEHAHTQLAAAGFLTSFGDAGQGGTAARDLYLRDDTALAASAALDAAGNLSGLDGGRAYASIDARVPSARIEVCVAQALIEAQLLELDPAEAASLRRASAAYFAALLTGGPVCEDDASAADPSASPFDAGRVGDGADWLRHLGIRQDGGRGTFLSEMWQFARQRTWEGRDLRASPDLMEAIGKALELQHDELPLVAAQIAESRLHEHHWTVPEVRWEKLPHFGKAQAVAPLGSAFVRVQLGAARPGARLRVWSRALGARFALAATRLDARGAVLSRVEAASWHEPQSQLSVELDPATRAVLISVTNVGDGTPDFDVVAEPAWASLTLDVAP